MNLPDNKPIDFGTYTVILILLALVIAGLLQWLGD